MHNSSNKLEELQNDDRRFISYLNTEKERVPGQVIDISSNSIVIKSLDGQNITIEGEQQLNTIWQDTAAKRLFEQTDIDLLIENHLQVTRENVEGQFDTTQIEISGDPAKDAFRRGLVAGVLKGDQRFISFGDDNDERTIAKVIEWNGDDIIFQSYNNDTDLLFLQKRKLSFNGEKIDDFFETVKVSSTAKDYFIRNSNTQDDDIDRILERSNTPSNISEEYHFLSQASPELKGEVYDFYIPTMRAREAIDWTDPSLKKWMRRATDIIKEKTGIVPGAQNLNANQRSQIYQVWFNDIVPLIEDVNGDKYGHIRRLTRSVSDPHLGHILDIKAAVCEELSEFGVILFSEYGLHTKLMSMGIIGESGHAWIKVHGDGFLEYINSNGKAKTPHTNLDFLKELYPNFTDDKISSFVEEVNLVIPPSQ